MTCDKCGRELKMILVKHIKIIVDPHPYFSAGVPKGKEIQRVYGGNGLKQEFTPDSFGYIEHTYTCEGKE